MFEDTHTITNVTKTNATNFEHQLVIDKLKNHINCLIATEPTEFDGHIWAKCLRNDLMQMLGVSRQVLNRILTTAPFNFDVIIDKNSKTKVTLIRIGPKGDWTARMAAKAMKRVWQEELLKFNEMKIAIHVARIKHLEEEKPFYQKEKASGGIAAYASHLPVHLQYQKAKEELAKIEKHLPSQKKKLEKAKLDAKSRRPVSPREFGIMVGLAEKWGPRSAARVLRFTMRHWSEFMVCLKVHLAPLEGEMDENGKTYQFKFFEFPALTVITRFYEFAIEIMMTELQATKPQSALALKKKTKPDSSFYAFVETLVDELVGKLKDEKQ